MKAVTIVTCAGALALLVAGTAARAEEGEAVKSILGAIGIIPKDKAPIEYRQRAPLVLPPKMELRAPGGGSAETANANWPKDPDVAAARKAAADAKTPWTEHREVPRGQGRRPLPGGDAQVPQPGQLHQGSDPHGRPGRQEHHEPRRAAVLRPAAQARGHRRGAALPQRSARRPPQGAGQRPPQGFRDKAPTVDPESPLGFIMQQNGQSLE